MLFQRVDTAAGILLNSFRLVERREKHGEESHVIAEGQPAGLAVALLQGMADTAVKGAVTQPLFVIEDGKHRSNISKHEEPPQAS